MFCRVLLWEKTGTILLGLLFVKVRRNVYDGEEYIFFPFEGGKNDGKNYV
ncbi:hypothetical protein SAMN05192534_10435 [Alteribacillus persepolensis]|uniref:Uncharacterized protein n=1 Tax=Alteribacillus persepolensis TaxID=568899 RepID=A0A1G8BFW8_9BACI|nr:hypothetical protein SAMN05192534_10435 [Alteribacillus persepolensis]